MSGDTEIRLRIRASSLERLQKGISGVRRVAIEPTKDQEAWRLEIEAYPGLIDTLDPVERREIPA